MISFYDFEVFIYDWLVVCIEPFEQKETVIINDRAKLEQFYNQHKKDIWIGYNNKSYDQYILKAILCDFDPKEVNDFMIKEHHNGWEYSSLFNKVPLLQYDCFTDRTKSLKELEGYMGNDIKESSVPFDVDRALTKDEIAETVKYCKHDVEQTMLVFNHRINEWNVQIDVLRAFDLPINNISKTQTQLSAVALGCSNKEFHDEWDYTIVDTLKLNKYNYVREWFEDPENHDYKKSLKTYVCGVPHVFRWGGLHGAIGQILDDKIINTPVHRKGLILHVDVTSFYPSIMIQYDMLSRTVSDKSVYKKIYDTRVKLKKAGKKKEQEPYKLILNKTYGGSGDGFSKLFDPRKRNEVCVNGQLLLLDLLEKLENHCDVIQSNTDGLIIQIPDTDEAFDKIDDICWEWEQRTHMGLSLDVISEIYQKDVNNYLWIDENGKLERKGDYVKELNDLDYDLPIINKALVDYMAYKIPVEDTIYKCNNLKEFQKIVKVSSKYEYAMHNGKQLNEKVSRVFATTDSNDGAIYKMKYKDDVLSPEKFANTAEHCFIENCNVNNMPVPVKLDYKWYIDLAKRRLQQYGVM
jgi:DNA polymerase